MAPLFASQRISRPRLSDDGLLSARAADRPTLPFPRFVDLRLVTLGAAVSDSVLLCGLPHPHRPSSSVSSLAMFPPLMSAGLPLGAAVSHARGQGRAEQRRRLAREGGWVRE